MKRLLLSALWLVSAIASLAQDKDLETIRERILTDILAPDVKVSAIRSYIQTQLPNGTWADIDYIDTSRTGFNHRVHLEHLESMSRAFRKPTSPLKGDASLKRAIDKALNHWLEKDYLSANWWWNEIGTPEAMINTLMMLDENLLPQQRAKALKIAARASLDSGVGPRPGGDLIKIAGMVGKQALFKRDVATLERVVRTIAGEIRISTERGLRPDMSFHHRTDGVISTLTYGMAYPTTYGYWNLKIAGTRFSFPEATMRLLVDYYIDGITKSMAFARYPDMAARNRDMTRRNDDHGAGPKQALNIAEGTSYRKEELLKIIASQSGNGKPAFEWNTFFPHSSYYTHQRPTWFSSVRMHSVRQNNVEFPYNEEGLKNHHLTDGACYITLTGHEYDGTAPVWDWQKIPGTTVLQKDSLPHWNEIVKKGRSIHVGAVSTGITGAASMHLLSVHDPLEAKKAWFHFKDGFVCLGTGISSSSPKSAATTLNQSSLQGAVTIKESGKISTLPKGTRTLSPSWIHHANIYYFLPAGGNIHLKNDVSYGNWRSINHQDWATWDTVKKDIFMAWFEHPGNRTTSSYAYTVVPGDRKNAAAAEAIANSLRILVNNENVQAVHDVKNDVLQIIFYGKGSLDTQTPLGTVYSEQPAQILIEGAKTNQAIRLYVSDPIRNKKSLKVAISGKHSFNVKSTWNQQKNLTEMDIPVPQGTAEGNTVSIQ